MKELLVRTDRFIYTRKIAFAPAQLHDHTSMQYAPGRRLVVQNARFCIDNLPALSGDLMWASIYESPGTRAERGVGVDAKRLAARSLSSIFTVTTHICSYRHFVHKCNDHIVICINNYMFITFRRIMVHDPTGGTDRL